MTVPAALDPHPGCFWAGMARPLRLAAALREGKKGCFSVGAPVLVCELL